MRLHLKCKRISNNYHFACHHEVIWNFAEALSSIEITATLQPLFMTCFTYLLHGLIVLFSQLGILIMSHDDVIHEWLPDYLVCTEKLLFWLVNVNSFTFQLFIRIWHFWVDNVCYFPRCTRWHHTTMIETVRLLSLKSAPTYPHWAGETYFAI